MISFYVDAALQPAILALFNEKGVIRKKFVEVGPLSKEDIFTEMDELLIDAPLDYVILGIGPGSYTGMRVALTLASTLAYSLNIPLITFTSMDGFVYKEPYIVVFDAKRNRVYIKEKEKQPIITEIEELNKYPNFNLITPHRDKLKLLFEGEWVYSEPNLEYLAILSRDKFDKKIFTDPRNVELLYLQNPYNDLN